MTSGAIQKGVPTNVFLLICVSVSWPATPKSASFTSPCSESSTLAAATQDRRRHPPHRLRKHPPSLRPISPQGGPPLAPRPRHTASGCLWAPHTCALSRPQCPTEDPRHRNHSPCQIAQQAEGTLTSPCSASHAPAGWPGHSHPPARLLSHTSHSQTKQGPSYPTCRAGSAVCRDTALLLETAGLPGFRGRSKRGTEHRWPAPAPTPPATACPEAPLMSRWILRSECR